MHKLKIKKIQKELMAWYQTNARTLPWRGLKDPYLIWISEVMLQQTQVVTVIPYFNCWIDRFPDIKSVADASLDEILKNWEGLGYYSRARNIKKTAEEIHSKYSGVFPSLPFELKKFTGIGEYIAGAIASIGFGLNEPALDANGVRVLARVSDFHGLTSIAANKKILNQNLRDLLPSGSAGDFNQAVMDLGSIICTPLNPRCGICPISDECLALSRNTQKVVPIKAIRSKKPHFNVVAGILEKKGKVLIGKRPINGLLGGMWEFPGGKIEKGEDHKTALKREFIGELEISVILKKSFGKYKHAYTHFSVTVYPYFVEILSGNPVAKVAEMIKWVNLKDLDSFPMGKVDRCISNDLIKKDKSSK